MRKRRRHAGSWDQGLALQDLLSNALAAIILLTLIAAAITGTGREFIRSNESGGTSPMPVEIEKWTRPPERDDAPPDTLKVEVAIRMARAVEGALLDIEGERVPERPASSWFRGGRNHDYALLLPIAEGAGWVLRLDRAEEVEELVLSVHAGANLVREARRRRDFPSCPQGAALLVICVGEGMIVRTELPSGCNVPRRCEALR